MCSRSHKQEFTHSRVLLRVGTGDGSGGWGGDKGHGQRRRGRDQRQIIGRTTRIVRGIRITPSAVCLDHRLVGSCLCSAWSTSVVAASVVGVLDVLIELGFLPVRWDGFLRFFEHLGRRVVMVLAHRRGHERGREKETWNLHRFHCALFQIRPDNLCHDRTAADFASAPTTPKPTGDFRFFFTAYRPVWCITPPQARWSR